MQKTQVCIEDNDVGHKIEPSSISAVLQKIWQELLHVSHVEPGDDFFDLGGDSLKAIRMLEHIGREYGEELLEPDIIYTASCFSDLTKAVTDALAQRALPATPRT